MVGLLEVLVKFMMCSCVLVFLSRCVFMVMDWLVKELKVVMLVSFEWLVFLSVVV